jgi:hypothetical protein
MTSQKGNRFPPVKSNSRTRKQVGSWIRVTLRESAWAPLSVVAFYLFGLAFHLYALYPNLDIPTHLFGGIAITYFYRVAIRNSQEFLGGIPLVVQILFAFTLTGTTIILWEFLETIVDYLFNARNVLGVFDTVKDMFVGLLGALLLTLFYRGR